MPKIYKGHNNKITSTPSNQLTLCYCRVKEEVTWMVNAELWRQLPLHQNHEKSTLSRQKENERKGIIYISKVIQPQTIFTQDDTFKLCLPSEGNFRCNF